MEQEVFWPEIVRTAWNSSGGLGSSDEGEDFVAAAIDDVGRSIRPLFSLLFGRIASLAAADSRDPLTGMRLLRAANSEVIRLPKAMVLDRRVERLLLPRVCSIVATRLNGYRRLAKSLRGLRSVHGAHSLTPLGRVARIDSLGDPHLDGDCVTRLTFASGIRYIYKPRDANAELLLNRFLGQCNFMASPIPVPACVLEGSSWWKEIDGLALGQSPDGESLWALSRNYGCALAMAVTFAIDDLHFENVIFGKDGGVSIVDLETAWSVRLPRDPKHFAGLDVATWIGLHTGLLPGLRILNDRIADESPLVKLLIEDAEGPIEFWKTVAPSSFIGIETVVRRPQSWFKTIRAGIADGLLAGSNSLREGIPNTVEIQDQCSQLRSRLVYRPTKAYYEILSKTIASECILERSYRSDLWRATFEQTAATAVHPEVHRRICELELASLSVGDIPHFCTDADARLFCGNEFVATHWRNDLLKVGAHLPELRRSDAWDCLRLVACRYIDRVEAVLSEPDTISRSTRKVASTTTTAAGRIDAAKTFVKEISAEILERSIELPNGQLNFIDFAPAGTNEEVSLQIVGPGLYRGTAGIGLGLWAASHLDHSIDSWRACFVDAFKGVESGSFADIAEHYGWSFSAGLAGIVVALTYVQQDHLYARRVRHSFERAMLEVGIPEAWTEWDYMGGIAGVLSCYATLARRSAVQPNGEALNHILRHVERVLEEHFFARTAQLQSEGRGFAHGASGVLYSLGRALEIWPTDTLEGLFQRALLQFQLETAAAQIKPWPNSGSWCGGAGGIIRALGRIRSRVENAPGWLVSAGARPTGRITQLCCGSLGRTILSIECQGSSLDAATRIDMGLELLGNPVNDSFVSFDVMDRPLRCVGLFQGLAGALYYGSFLSLGQQPHSIEMMD